MLELGPAPVVRTLRPGPLPGTRLFIDTFRDGDLWSKLYLKAFSCRPLPRHSPGASRARRTLYCAEGTKQLLKIWLQEGKSEVNGECLAISENCPSVLLLRTVVAVEIDCTFTVHDEIPGPLHSNVFVCESLLWLS